MSNKWPTGNLVSQLKAWAPLVSSGYECPAAGTAMNEAADTITRLTAENERLRGKLEWAAKELELLYFFAISNGIAEAGIPPHVELRAAIKDSKHE